MCTYDNRCRSTAKKTTRKSKTKSKTRNKRRKPKFLSLSLQLNLEKKSEPLDHMSVSPSTASTHDHQDPHQLNLFPLHPENLVDDKDTLNDQENVEALFFSGDENSVTTLTGLLTSSKDESEMSNTSVAKFNYTFADTITGHQGELVRTALRNKEREVNKEEEKWVVYSDVVDTDQHSETTRKDEEVSSCSTLLRDIDRRHKKQQQLSLKLDYEEILTAWSDKGPLYLQDQSPQIVPDILDDFLSPFSSHGLRGGWDNSAVQYRVPQVKASEQISGDKTTESIQEDELKGGRSRQASVLRYKEKRHNRLFAKKIRYEVRKLNAEKRPRVKGRFVKRD